MDGRMPHGPASVCSHLAGLLFMLIAACRFTSHPQRSSAAHGLGQQSQPAGSTGSSGEWRRGVHRGASAVVLGRCHCSGAAQAAALPDTSPTCACSSRSAASSPSPPPPRTVVFPVPLRPSSSMLAGGLGTFSMMSSSCPEILTGNSTSSSRCPRSTARTCRG